MDKNAIKKFAVWARRELIEKVSQKALQYGIEEGKELDSKLESINGVLLSDDEKKQRQALIRKINENGYTQVMEEVAYTWFNRFIALRFMEVNGYLPSHVRVFTDENNNFKPQIISEALHLDYKTLDNNKIMEMKQASRDDDLYKYLLLSQCNELSSILPKMFQKIADYTELLLPDYLLREGSVIERMINLIPEEDWADQIQIIGWLYQDYNSELKDEVFEKASTGKISKEEIPAATQLFTPDWIVRFLVDNSLGRKYVIGHEDFEKLAFYLPEVNEIENNNVGIDPKTIRCIDPCCGSGHMVCYMFDVLIKEYVAYGYSQRDAVRSIIDNNIVGIDIDNRAAQLSYFSIMMKAAQYDRRFLRNKDEYGNPQVTQPHIYSVVSSDTIDTVLIEEFIKGNKEIQESLNTVLYAMKDAKEFGSLIKIPKVDYSVLQSRLELMIMDNPLIGSLAQEELQPLLDVARALSEKYDVVVTNPPYMGSANMGANLLDYVKKEYGEGKNDLFSCFILRCIDFAKRDGYVSMITQSAWMFQSRFEALRNKLSSSKLICMAHLGTRAFDSISGEVVQTTAFCYQNTHDFSEKYVTQYVKLTDYKGEAAKEEAFFDKKNYYQKYVKQFDVIPGKPMAYYISDDAIKVFETGEPLKNRLIPKQGTSTGDDKTYVRSWYEIDFTKFKTDCRSTEEAHESGFLYFPLDKGGEYRKWYGNNERVIRFDSLSYNKLLEMGNHLPSRQYYFMPGLTWSKIASELSVRYDNNGFVFSSVGLKGFPDEKYRYYILGFMNSSVCKYFIKVLSPGMSIVSGDIEKLPFIFREDDEINDLVKENISITKWDWDNSELSWDFKTSPLINRGRNVEESVKSLRKEYTEKIDLLRNNERILNIKFAEIYGLKNEIDIEVDDASISVKIPSEEDCVKSFISFAIGCILGRYSLDHEGIAYAGGSWQPELYTSYCVDEDGILPITDDEYLHDDTMQQLLSFIEAVYGKDELDNCISYMGMIIGGKGSARDNIRSYMIDEFYKDHCRTYQKKPIYWLFDSGKNNGFKCLVYYHRYKQDTAARIRTDYVHELQSRYRTAIEELSGLNDITVKQKKMLNKLKNQEDEIGVFEEKIHHLADLMIELNIDESINDNYKLFNDVLARI